MTKKFRPTKGEFCSSPAGGETKVLFFLPILINQVKISMTYFFYEGDFYYYRDTSFW